MPPRNLFALLAALAACNAPPSPPPPREATDAPPPLAAVSGACAARDDSAAGDPDDSPDFERHAVDRPEDAADTCAVADSNLERAASAVLAAARPAPGATRLPRWDHRTRPLRIDDVARRFALAPAETSALQKNGFVVPARLEFPTYADALHEVYQSELPLFVSVDAVLHAVFVGNDRILARLEERRLLPLLTRTLAVMHCALAGAGFPEETARDLDVYLTTARWLLADHPVAPVLNESTAPASTLVTQARAAAGTRAVTLFGRELRVDFTAFTPHGHYAAQSPLAPYFRASAWLARVEAPALADLATRAGVGDSLRTLRRAWATFPGAPVLPVALLTPAGDPVGAADLAFALGQDRARAYLGAREARAVAHTPTGREDLDGLWVRAVLGLAERPAGALPSFMAGDAFADLRLDSAITAVAQVRHDAVLHPGQAYDEGGCAIPDGYVEPAPAVYQALIAYAESGAAAVTAVDPGDDAGARAYFTRLARTLRVLDAIAADELGGRALSADALAYLSMVLEMTPASTTGEPTFTGWYFDLFPARLDALARASFVTAYFISAEEQTVAYAGATGPRLGVFVIDTDGAPRVVVGPVARGYEHHGPLAPRLDDEAASRLAAVDDPWAASYTVPAPPAPDLALSFDGTEATLTAPLPLGPVTVEALDHHRRLIEAVTHHAAAGETTFTFSKATDERPIEMLHVQAGTFHAWSSTWRGGPLELTTRNAASAAPEAPEEVALPRRPARRGVQRRAGSTRACAAGSTCGRAAGSTACRAAAARPGGRFAVAAAPPSRRGRGADPAGAAVRTRALAAQGDAHPRRRGPQRARRVAPLPGRPLPLGRRARRGGEGPPVQPLAGSLGARAHARRGARARRVRQPGGPEPPHGGGAPAGARPLVVQRQRGPLAEHRPRRQPAPLGRLPGPALRAAPAVDARAARRRRRGRRVVVRRRRGAPQQRRGVGGPADRPEARVQPPGRRDRRGVARRFAAGGGRRRGGAALGPLRPRVAARARAQRIPRHARARPQRARRLAHRGSARPPLGRAHPPPRADAARRGVRVGGPLRGAVARGRRADLVARQARSRRRVPRVRTAGEQALRRAGIALALAFAACSAPPAPVVVTVPVPAVVPVDPDAGRRERDQVHIVDGDVVRDPRGSTPGWRVRLRLFPGDPTASPGRGLAVAADGSVLAGASDGSLVGIDAGGTPRFQLGVRGPVTGLAARPDGDFAVTTAAGVVVLGPGGVVRSEPDLPPRPTMAYRARRNGIPAVAGSIVVVAPRDAWALDGVVLQHYDGKAWRRLAMPELIRMRSPVLSGRSQFQADRLERGAGGRLLLIGAQVHFSSVAPAIDGVVLRVFERDGARFREPRDLRRRAGQDRAGHAQLHAPAPPRDRPPRARGLLPPRRLHRARPPALVPPGDRRRARSHGDAAVELLHVGAGRDVEPLERPRLRGRRTVAPRREGPLPRRQAGARPLAGGVQRAAARPLGQRRRRRSGRSPATTAKARP